MKQKLILLVLALFTTIGAWAATYTITYKNGGGGTFYQGGNAVATGNAWAAAEWVSGSEAPIVTFSNDANNGFNTTNYNLARDRTFTISVAGNYLITGYTISSTGWGSTVTPAGKSGTVFTSGVPVELEVDDLCTTSTSFSNSGANLPDPTITITIVDAINMTYKVVYDDNVLDGFDTDKPSKEGAALAVPTSLERDGVTFSYYTDKECTSPISTVPGSATTIFAKATYSLSALLSADTDHFSWYRLAASSNSSFYDLYYNDTAPYRYKEQSAFDGSDGYFWAFIGDPFNGVKVYNKATLASKTMIHNDNTNPVMGTDDGTKWYITLYDSKIGFKYTGNTGHRWNDHGGGAASLKYYGSESWHAYTNINDVDYSSLYNANIKPYIVGAGDGYFKISSTDATTLSGEYATANSDSKITLSEYSSLITSLNNKINWPTTGYYRVKSNSAKTYLKAESASQLTVGGTNTQASTIVYLNGSAGTYTMQMQGQYVKIQANSSASYLGEGSSNVYLTVPVVSSAISPGKVTIGGKGSATDYMRVNDGNVIGLAMGTNPTDQPTAYWTFEDATDAMILMNDGGDGSKYATLYLPFDATIKDADAFTLAKSGSYLVPTTVTGNKVPAGTPVLLKGTNATATATINTGEAFNSGSPLGCVLTGTYTDMSVTKTEGVSNDYYLGKSGSVVGFYKWDGTTLKANRAYLTAANAAVKGFVLMFDEDDETSINTVNGSELMVNGPIYNLAGQRLNKMQKGINIVNGKKVLK